MKNHEKVNSQTTCQGLTPYILIFRFKTGNQPNIKDL